MALSQRWQFMDKIVERLNERDPRWGYICVGGNCDDISTDTIGYLCDDSDTGTIPVDIIDADGNVQWDVNEPGDDTWKFPRVEDDDNGDDVIVDNDVSDFSWDKVRWLNSHNVSCWPEASQISSVEVRQSGQICIDHSKKGQWPEAFPIGSDPLEGNPYIIVKIDGTYYAATYEWLRPGQVCKLGFAGPLSITYAGEDSLGRHTKRPPLQDWEPKGGEVIGFMVSGLARLRVKPNAVERSQIVWYRLPSVDGSIQGGEVGRFSGVATVGNGCRIEGFEEGHDGGIVDAGICTPEQLEDGFLSMNDECLPLCARLGFYGEGDTPLGNISDEYYDLYGHILRYVEINEGDACDPDNSENEDYNILPITIKTISALSGTTATSCCRRSKKKDCSALSPHYSLKTVGGEESCYPSCGQAANLAGYSVTDHIQSDLNKACNASTIGGQYPVGTWKTIPDFYDPYNFKVLDSTKVVTDPNQRCCVKGSPFHEPSLEHNADGTYNVIAGVPVSTTTTTSGTSSGTTSTTNNRGNGNVCDEQACAQSCEITGFCNGEDQCECIGSGP